MSPSIAPSVSPDIAALPLLQCSPTPTSGHSKECTLEATPWKDRRLTNMAPTSGACLKRPRPEPHHAPKTMARHTDPAAAPPTTDTVQSQCQPLRNHSPQLPPEPTRPYPALYSRSNIHLPPRSRPTPLCSAHRASHAAPTFSARQPYLALEPSHPIQAPPRCLWQRPPCPLLPPSICSRRSLPPMRLPCPTPPPPHPRPAHQH